MTDTIGAGTLTMLVWGSFLYPYVVQTRMVVLFPHRHQGSDDSMTSQRRLGAIGLLVVLFAVVAVLNGNSHVSADQTTPVEHTFMTAKEPQQQGDEEGGNSDDLVLVHLENLENDVGELRDDIKALDQKIDNNQAALHNKIDNNQAALHNKIDSNQAALHNKIDSNLHWLIGTMIVTMAMFAGVVLGAVKMMMNKSSTTFYLTFDPHMPLVFPVVSANPSEHRTEIG